MNCQNKQSVGLNTDWQTYNLKNTGKKKEESSFTEIWDAIVRTDMCLNASARNRGRKMEMTFEEVMSENLTMFYEKY